MSHQHGSQRRGFGDSKQKRRSSSYWVAAYAKDDEDTPVFVTRNTIEYVPGQNIERLMLLYCHSLLVEKPDIWEVLVHQGPDEVPQSGEQIVARLSREPFDQAKVLEV